MSAGANLSLKSRRSVTPFDLARILVDQKVMKKMKPQVARKSTSDRHFVKELQSLLYLRGYKTGVPDGVRGNKTASALRFYNWALGRKVSSETSIEVLNSLWKHIDHSGAVGNLSGGFAISNVQEHMSWNYLTDGQGAAHSKAIKNCKKNARGSCNKWNVGFTKGCFAYATTGRKTWAYQVSPTIWEARRKALKACHKLKNGQCRLSIEFCSDGSFTYKRQVR